MEYYYFIEKNGTKQGPYKLIEFKQQTIFFDQLIWRSDSDKWIKATEFEELSDVLIVKPPLTPKEQKIAVVNKNFISKTVGSLAIFYVISSLLIGFLSFSIAQASWDSYLKETDGKYIPEINSIYNYQYPSDGVVFTIELLDNKRYPWYQRGVNMENINGLQQGLLFRSFKSFYSTIYLTREEQNNSSSLLMNLMLSSFASLSFIFVAFGMIYYVVKRNNQDDKS